MLTADDMNGLSRNSCCRICKGIVLRKIMSFGKTPPANAFLRKEQLAVPEQLFPLDVYLCQACGLVQLVDVVSPDVLFRDYVYVSSTAASFAAHFAAFAASACARFSLGGGSLVVDIGSNDGVLLAPFRERGIAVLGIEPAATVAEIARQRGIETVPAFFSAELAGELAKKRRASVITATNVFAHINELDDALTGVRLLLAEDGVFIIEVPYLGDLIEKNLFDTVYHEHLSYFALKPLSVLFERFGMAIVDVEKVGTHGGSIRVYAKKAPADASPAVAEFRAKEQLLQLDAAETYRAFMQKIEKNRAALAALLLQLKADGKSVAGYGAPAKSTTLLHYFGIGAETIGYIVDDSAYKQGLYTPGTHIPVVGPELLHQRRPDCLLILAWNFADEIMKKNEWFSRSGGKFIVPVPEPKVL